MGKAASVRPVSVCLLSRHPGVLSAFQEALLPAEFRIHSLLLDTIPNPEPEALALPPAELFVVDAYAPPPFIEGLLLSIRDRLPTSNVLLVAKSFVEANAFLALRSGAKGLLTYEQARERLSDAARVVASGGYWVSRQLLSRFVGSIVNNGARGHAHRLATGYLSRREREVLECVLSNQSNKEIAGRLNFSERTAKFHVANLLAKFGVRRRADLILLSIQQDHG